MTTTKNDIDGCTRLVGVVGWPIGSWPQVVIYNSLFDALGLNWCCVPLPARSRHLRDAFLGLRALNFAGAIVLPTHQRSVLEYLDEVSPAAEIIGSVDLICSDDQGRLVGENLGWLAFAATLHTIVPSLIGLQPLIIGAGEMASSVVYALTREGLPLTVVDRHIDRAIDLVRRVRHALDEHSLSVHRWPQDAKRVATNVNLIVNTCDAGNGFENETSPWPDDLGFPSDALVFDLTTWSDQTRFQSQARMGAALTINALPVAVYETTLAIEKWTGYSPPTGVVWQASEGVLAREPTSEAFWSMEAVAQP